jgi:beta-lactamase regulating signal transducer with metallopeptidase domain
MQFGASVVPFLISLAVRSLALAAIALAAIYILRMQAAAARHAVWTAVVAGMLLLPAVGPLLPSIPLRILRPQPAAQASADALPAMKIDATAELPASAPPAVRAGMAVRPVAPIRHPLTWLQAAGAAYFAGVAVFLCMFVSGYCAARKLVSHSTPLERLGAGVLESTSIAVPVTIGFLRPKILLPLKWRDWPAEKLEAVLVHERTHVRRADWAIAVAAGLNRRLFWFHPLAWWLERHLAVLAERACDDAALLALGACEAYAQTLLDMAAVVQTSRGRMVGETMAMAKTAEVRKRIERILDETRQIPRAWTGARWATLAACSLPLAYLVSVTQLAPAQEVRVASAAVTPPVQQSAPPKPESQTAQLPPPGDVKPAVPFRRTFAPPRERRFFLHDTPHAGPIVIPSARPRWFFFSNYKELATIDAAPPIPAQQESKQETAEPPPAKFVVEVDASSQPPYPYRPNIPNILPLHKVAPVYPTQAKAAGPGICEAERTHWHGRACSECPARRRGRPSTD